MALKRNADINQKGASDCLKCGRPLEKLRDNKVSTCAGCGQQHLVDKMGSRITLTVAERPELRHRDTKRAIQEQAQKEAAAKIEHLLGEIDKIKRQHEEIIAASLARDEAKKAEIALLRKEIVSVRRTLAATTKREEKLKHQLKDAEANAKEWEKAADGLAKHLEILKAQGKW